MSLFKNINKKIFLVPGIKKIVIISTIIGILTAILPVVTEFIMSLITNYLQDAYRITHVIDERKTTICVLLYIGNITLPFLFAMIDRRITARLGLPVRNYLTVLLKKKTANLDLAYSDDPQFHDMLKNVREKGVDMTFGFFNLQFNTFEIMINLVLTSAVISLLGFGYLALLVCSLIPMVVYQIVFKKKRKVFLDSFRSESRYANEYAGEAGTRESRVFEVNDSYINRFKKIIDSLTQKNISFDDQSSLINLVTNVIFFAALGFVVYHIFFMIAGNVFKLGTGLFILRSTWMFTGSLRSIISLIADFYENAIYSEEFIEVLELPQLVYHRPDPIILSLVHAPRIVFDRVSFFYTNKELPALDHVSFAIDAGSKIAFVGDNGGGKSTAVKLLLRFYDPSSGRILIDGEDLRDVDLYNFHKSIGYVAQNPSIPNLTLREVLSNDTDVSDEILMWALKRSRADDFVKDFKSGLDQQLGRMFDGGVALSDGQRQKIAVSRAYVHKPKIVILDEPTSDLDPQTQVHVFNGFYENDIDYTGVLVAHALQGVKFADAIHVFQGGKLTQVGSHTQLIHLNGWYKKSFEEQFNLFKAFA